MFQPAYPASKAFIISEGRVKIKKHFPFGVFFIGFVSGVLYLASCGTHNNTGIAGSATTPFSVFSNGTLIGSLVSVASTGYVVYSSTGYLYSIRSGGSVGALPSTNGTTLYYASADCSGQAYALNYAAAGYDNVGPMGWVFAYPNPPGTIFYYVPKTASAVTIPVANSTGVSGYCGALGSPQTNLSVFQAFPNDGSVTGVSQTTYSTPITVGLSSN